ncbi:MAG: exo-alpha-sialidase, partial [Bacteroidetes bacterium]|nr:exo-alpha-sialidase [Bacteroidota bacterium]
MGRSPFAGLYSHFSTDNGQTWSFQNAISTDDLERATITTDAIKTSSFYGRSYAAWVRFTIPFSLWLAYTDDGAQNWSPPQQINDQSPDSRSAGGDMAIGPNG